MRIPALRVARCELCQLLRCSPVIFALEDGGFFLFTESMQHVGVEKHNTMHSGASREA